jgi:hypothetical protein
MLRGMKRRAALGLLSLSVAVATFAACGEDDSGTGGGTSTPTGTTTSSGGAGGVGGIGGTATATGGMGGMGGSEGGGGMGGGCVNSLPTITAAPAKLSETGLYSDIASKTISVDAQGFEPQFKLWSDDATKQRWAYLPECDVIDNSDEDNWSFPVGTRMWKEFSLNGVLLETRLVHRYGPGTSDYLFATYVWDAMGDDADLTENGATDVNGTTHDVPPTNLCGRCHGPHAAKGGLPSRFLGFGAVQLSHSGSGVTMASLSNGSALMVPNAAGYTVPGTPTDQAALGYFHANCASCHNDSSDGLLFPPLDMRLRAADSDVTQTASYLDLVNQLIGNFNGPCSHLIAGQDVANSCVHYRMSNRNSAMAPNVQMPPIATDVVDPTGVATIEAWIATLPMP